MFYYILLHLLPIAAIFYIYITRKYSYWSKLGLKGPTPSLLNFGNVRQIQGQDPLVVELELARKYGKLYGNYTGLEPTLTVSDPALIKQILIKDFPSFVNRRKITTYHHMVNNGLFFTNDEKWKRLRTVASPTFTTGKLRKFVPLIHQCIDRLEGHFGKLATSNGGLMADTRTTLTGFTVESIALTVFATQTNSTGAAVNQFVSNGIKISDASTFAAVSYFVMPKWFNKLFGIEHPFNVESLEFYTNATKAILKQSSVDGATNGSKHHTNLVQILMKASQKSYVKTEGYDELTASMEKEFTETSAKSTETATLSDEEIVGIATGIFLAGFDTTALTISSLLYELALQPELQERLYAELTAELDGLVEQSDEYLELIMNQLPYLDAVIKETLRKYPVLARLERRVAVDHYKLAGVPLVKDQLVEISVAALHYDPDLYPEPFRFNPERFMPENKNQLAPHSFIPFGDGPRNCMGMRFAYQEMKLCLSRVLRKFRFELTPETPRSLTFLPFKFVLNSPPVPLKVVRRM